MKRNRYTSILRTSLAALFLAAAAACSDDAPNDAPLPGDDDATNPDATNLVTVRFGSGTPDGDATQAGTQSAATKGTEETFHCLGEYSGAWCPSGGRPETRTTIDPNDGATVRWATTDAIGISAVSTSYSSTTKKYNPARADVTSDFTPADGGGEMALAEGTYTFYSYYPWQNGNNGYEYVQFTLGDFTQSAGDNTDHIGPMDFMYAKTEPISVRQDNEPQVTFAYAHAFPMLRVTNETGNSLKYICVRSAMSHVAGKVSINLSNGKVTVVDKEKNIIKLSFSPNLSNGSTGTLLLLPQEADTELIIGTEDTEGNIYEITKTAPAGDGLAGGKVYQVTFTPNDLYSEPAMKGGSYQISNETELRWLAMTVNYYGKADVNAQLTADIELDKYTNWEPIGTEKTPYTGTFDGKGKTVSKLAINSTLKYYIGFFGYLNKATVSNLHVNGSVTAAQSNWVGGIVGEAENSTISHCLFTGDVRGYNHVGGIVGAFSNGSITGCYTSGNVTGGYLSAGGIVGNSSGNTSLSNCYSSANVTVPYKYAGGIVGNNNISISTCYATGTVTAPENCGGITGYNNATGSITQCIALNTAIVRTNGSTKETFGRVAGVNNKEDGIRNCAAWNGMTVAGTTITTGDGGATIHGAPLTASQCVTSATYTGTPYNFDTNEWDFDTQGQYLPWNKVLFGYWPDAVKVEATHLKQQL